MPTGVETIREKQLKSEEIARRGQAAQQARLKRLAAAAEKKLEAKSKAAEILADEKRDAAFKEAEKNRFLLLGGTPAEFELAWPKLRMQILTREIEAAPDNSTATAARRLLKGMYARP